MLEWELNTTTPFCCGAKSLVVDVYSLNVKVKNKCGVSVIIGQKNCRLLFERSVQRDGVKRRLFLLREKSQA